MPRPRLTNPLNLPPRVTMKHGAFYYRHRDGRWERLGTDVEEAKRRGKHFNDPDSAFGTMAWYFDQFILFCEERVKGGKLAARTLADYRDNIVPLKAYAGHLAPADVTPSIVQTYLDIGVECDRQTRANREKACLSACMTWIRTRRPEAALLANPCFGVRRNSEKPRDVYVETADFNKVKAKASPMCAAFAELVYRTLQRPADVLTWTRANIRTIEQAGQLTQVLMFKQSKTGAQLVIEIDAHLAELLKAIKRDAIGMPLIYKSRRFKGTADAKPWHELAYTEEGIASMWRRWCHEAGVNSFGIMDLRGKGATDMYQAGIPLETIQALMGHESITTTEIYVKRRLRRVVQPNKVGLTA